MKVNIKECVLKYELDLDRFKKDFGKDMHLEYAINNNVKITYNKGFPTNTALRFIFLAFDWGGFFKQLPNISKSKIQFKAHNVAFEGFKKIVPLTTTETMKDMQFKYEDCKDGVIIIQDGIPNPNFALDNLFSSKVFDFGNKTYRLDVELK